MFYHFYKHFIAISSFVFLCKVCVCVYVSSSLSVMSVSRAIYPTAFSCKSHLHFLILLSPKRINILYPILRQQLQSVRSLRKELSEHSYRYVSRFYVNWQSVFRTAEWSLTKTPALVLHMKYLLNLGAGGIQGGKR